MTHSFGFSGVDEKLFILQQLQMASRDYCRYKGIRRDSHPYGHDDWNDYGHAIKRVVSSHMIEIAAKVRILQDSTVDLIRPSIFKRAEEYALEDVPLGKVHAGSFELSVRETCNKIIHATRVELCWITRKSRALNGYTYWTGRVDLRGEMSKRAWHLELDVFAWCSVVDIYLDHVLSSAGSDGIQLA